MGSTMDLALIKELFQNLSLAAEVLEIQDDIVEEVRKVWIKLPEYQIGQYGQIQEWEKDFPNRIRGIAIFFRSSGISSGDNHQSI